jgi:hypothetical protein
MKNIASAALGVIAATAIGGCGGGGGGSGATAPLSLSVTDAPINSTAIDRVCVDFTRITVHYAGQEEVVLDYKPLPAQVRPATHCITGVWDGTGPVPPVRLNALGGALTVALAESLQVPVGRITWIRLHFTDKSYVLDNLGGQHALRCPSCETTDNNSGRGFKLNRTFEVGSGGLALAVDVDLKRSLVTDPSGYMLRPTARIEDSAEVGTIAGEVNADVLSGQGGMAYTGTTTETGCAVYVYANHNTTPDDFYDGSPVTAAARVLYSEAVGRYRYAVGALPGGTTALPTPYSVALTCDVDDPMVDDTTAAVKFTAGKNADLVIGQTTTVDFAP